MAALMENASFYQVYSRIERGHENWGKKKLTSTSRSGGHWPILFRRQLEIDSFRISSTHLLLAIRIFTATTTKGKEKQNKSVKGRNMALFL